MSSVYDGNLTVSIFGQSHAPAIGVTIDGLPAGLPVDLDALGRFLRRRAPGQNAWSTPRKEADLPEFLCGLKDGRTCGAPLTAIIRNTNTRSGDYENLMDIPRPGHADYTAQVKFGGAQDAAGGGHFSGRLTAPLCIAGGLCLQILARQGVRVRARIVSIGTVTDDAAFDAPVDEKPFPAVSDEAAAAMQAQIAQVKAEQDSVGGVIECVIEGLPAGIGDPMFGGLENRIARTVFAIPAVKGVEFGAGFAAARLRGSENNDPFCVENGKIVTKTNHCGGILGGISNGMPVVFRAAFKPTPSISREQDSVADGGDEARHPRAARPLHRPARGPVRGGGGGHRRARRGDGAEKGAWIWILRRCAAVCSAGSSATATPLPSTSGWRIIRTGCLRWSRRTSAPFYRKGPSTD